MQPSQNPERASHPTPVTPNKYTKFIRYTGIFFIATIIFFIIVDLIPIINCFPNCNNLFFKVPGIVHTKSTLEILSDLGEGITIAIINISLFSLVIGFVMAFLPISKPNSIYRYNGKKLLQYSLLVSIIYFLFFGIMNLLLTPIGSVGFDEKPVIYLYPTETTNVTVQLDYQGTLVADYPAYDSQIGGWSITVEPDGTITNHADGREYSYLFWEGAPDKLINWDMSSGFIVKGSETREFLQQKLAEMGLTPREYNEFIVYWYPQMKNNPYNLIHFAGEQYTEQATLTITPEPDSLLRVFMVYKSLNTPKSITPQTISTFKRTGFTVVEWGGSEVK